MSQRSIHHYLRPNHLHPKQALGRDRQIEIILENIDFNKIQNVMTHLNWDWYPINRIPNIVELKSAAKNHLERVWDMKETGEDIHYYTGSGGFMAHKWVYDGLRMLSLDFTIAGWELEYDDVQDVNYS